MRYICLVLAIFIAGCTTIPRQEVDIDTPLDLDTWEIKGRLAAKIDSDGGSASFIWHRQGEVHNIELYGPLGSGRVFLKQAGGRASLIDNSTEFFGDSLEDVLFQRVGWLIPFDKLQRWLVGQPQLEAISDQKYDQNTLTEFRQAGWQVNYEKFKDYSGDSIPGKITLIAGDDYLGELSDNAGHLFEQAKVKIIIKSFKRG